MKANNKQVEQVNKIKKQMEEFTSDYCVFEVAYEISEGYCGEEDVRVEFTVKDWYGNDIIYYFNVREDSFEWEVCEECIHPFDREEFWKYMASELSKELKSLRRSV